MCEILICDEWLVRPAFVPQMVRNQDNEYGQQAAAKGENAPHQALPVGGICGALIGVAGGTPSLLHTVMVLSSRLSTGATRQRKGVDRNSDPLQRPISIRSVCMRQHGAQCVEARFAEVLRTGKRAGAIVSQFRQHASGIPFAIDTAGIRHHGQPRNLIPESQRDVAILIVTVTIEPRGHRVDLEILSIRRPIGRPSDCQCTAASR